MNVVGLFNSSYKVIKMHYSRLQYIWVIDEHVQKSQRSPGGTSDG
jgi:hypothetical protein